MALKIMHHGSDNLIRWKDAKNETDGSVITGATVTAKVTEADGTVVAAAVAMVDQGAGLYEGTFTDTDAATLTKGENVEVEITFDGGAGLRRVFTESTFVDN